MHVPMYLHTNIIYVLFNLLYLITKIILQVVINYCLTVFICFVVDQ